MSSYETNSLWISGITSFIALVAAIGAIFYSIIANSTLKEIKKQREGAYMPELIIASTPFYLYSNENEEYPTSFSFEYNKEMLNNVVVNPFISTKMQAFNVGMGVAKNVTFLFNFDLEKIKQIITDFSTTDDWSPHKHFDLKFDDLGVSINGLNGLTVYMNPKPVNFSFILPTSINSNATLIDLPMHISNLYVIYAYIRIKQRNLYKIPDFPLIETTIKYQDINNKEFVKNMVLALKFEGGRLNEIWNEMEVSNL